MPQSPDDPDACVDAVPSPRWEARLFGDFRLIAPDGSDATPVGRKARALVAYLMTTAEDGATRDRLVGLLWGERGDDQARASLRQMLTTMRPLIAVDRPLVVVDRIRARIAVESARTDLQDLHALAARHDAVGLATLIGEQPPDLLTDLDGIDPGFDEWLVLERTRRADERRSLVLGVAANAIASGDAASASTLAKCLLRRDPTDEAAARVAMEALGRQGDRDAVRMVFSRLKGALRTELGVDPAEESVDVHRRWMNAPTDEPVEARDTPSHAAAPPRIEAPVRVSVDAEESSVVPPPPSDPAAPPPARPAHRRIAVIGLSCVVALVAASIAGYLAVEKNPRPAIRVLSVQPLQAAADDSAAHALRNGLSADIARLIVGNDETLRVVDLPQQADAAVPNAFRVDGDARSDTGLLHATIRVSREAGGPILWSETFVRPVAELDALREEIASRIGDVSICALGRTNPGVARFSAEALRLLFAACEQKHLFNADEVTKLLRQLLILQPDFVHGWGTLAAGEQFVAQSRLADAPALEADAERDARHAMALDPRDGEAYYALALGLHGKAHWLERMSILLRGHALDPTNGEVAAGIAGNLLEVGRWHEAENFFVEGVSADPFGVFKIADLAHVRGFGSDVAGGITTLMTGRKRFGKHLAIAREDFRFHALLGDPLHAKAILDDPARGFVLQPAEAALWDDVITARSVPSADNEARVQRAVTAAMRTPGANARLVIELLARGHRVDEAFAFFATLPPALREDLPTAILFESPTEPLRADRRFMTLATRLGLVAIWRQTGKWPDFCGDRSVDYDCRIEADRAVSAASEAPVAK